MDRRCAKCHDFTSYDTCNWCGEVGGTKTVKVDNNKETIQAMLGMLIKMDERIAKLEGVVNA